MKEERGVSGELLKAIDLAVAGKWDAAHRLVQQFEANRTAAWIHAVLHKIEGDMDNSRYWYRKAGKMDCVDHQPQSELQAIKRAIVG